MTIMKTITTVTVIMVMPSITQREPDVVLVVPRHWGAPEATTLLLPWALLPPRHHVPHSAHVPGRQLERAQWPGGGGRVPAVPPRMVLLGWSRTPHREVQLWALLPPRYRSTCGSESRTFT